MRKIADGEQYTSPATIDDPAILGEIGEALQGLGCACTAGVARGIRFGLSLGIAMA